MPQILGDVLHVEIVLIRHAQPQRWEGEGRADPQLTLHGRSQAQQLVEFLTGEQAPSFQGLYSSTMTRAVETAAPLARALGLESHALPELVEYDHELNFYLPTEDIQEDFEEYWENLQKGFYVGHEIDLPAFQARVVGAIDRVIDAHDGDDRVAIICHGGVISTYLSSVLGNSQPLFIEPEYTSISRVHVYPEGRRHVLSANETPHLGFSGWESSLV